MIKKSVQNISKKFKPTIYEYFGTRLHKHTNTHTHTHTRARARAHARTHAHTQTCARARVGIHISVDADKENTWKPISQYHILTWPIFKITLMRIN